MLDSIEYGFQIENQSIGRISTQWRLLGGPSPGAVNIAAAGLFVIWRERRLGIERARARVKARTAAPAAD